MEPPVSDSQGSPLAAASLHKLLQCSREKKSPFFVCLFFRLLCVMEDHSAFMQDELRHPLVEASTLLVVVTNLLQPAVVGFGVLQGRGQI